MQLQNKYRAQSMEKTICYKYINTSGLCLAQKETTIYSVIKVHLFAIHSHEIWS